MAVYKVAQDLSVRVLTNDAALYVEVVNSQRLGDKADFGPAICDTPPHIEVIAPKLAWPKQTGVYENLALYQHGACPTFRTLQKSLKIAVKILLAIKDAFIP